ncbi:MAG: hypothetical protein ABI112_10175, partial [Terracoccus sp.]
MNTTGSLLERLRQQLADLEANQRRSGGTATAGFWTTPSPDAAEPAPGARSTAGAGQGPGSPELPHPSRPGTGADEPVSPGPGPDASRPAGEYPAPLTIHWANWSKVSGAYASGFAFAVATL